jgi:membrane-bound lytic murein transglycosylase D
MNYHFLYFFVLLISPLYAQTFDVYKGLPIVDYKRVYLDSVKSSFVRTEAALLRDSIWIAEMTNDDFFNDSQAEIESSDSYLDYNSELTTEVLQSRLKYLNSKSPFEIRYNETIENVIRSYLKNRKTAFSKILGMSEYYFPIYEEVFAKRNIPLEIKYLSIVESALNPKAVSRMGARGLWQFMYPTAKDYNLHIDSYIDERSDPLKSTEASAEYMSRMHKVFGDWEMVLASYNCGPGNVSKAIRRSGGKKSFWEIRNFLPKETRDYVPKFIATMYLCEFSKEHNIIPKSFDLKLRDTDTIAIRKQISFKQISDLLDISIAEIELLNPTYNQKLIPSYENYNHFLRLPNDRISLFLSNESKIYDYVEYMNHFNSNPVTINTIAVVAPNIVASKKSIYYQVKKGDYLASIAKKYQTTVTNIKKLNNLKSNFISIGMKLLIK